MTGKESSCTLKLSSLPVQHKEGKQCAVGHLAQKEGMAQHALASTPGMHRVPLCQIIVLAEVQGKRLGGGSVPWATVCSKGHLLLRFSSFGPAVTCETRAEEPKP